MTLYACVVVVCAEAVAVCDEAPRVGSLVITIYQLVSGVVMCVNGGWAVPLWCYELVIVGTM